MEEPIVKIGDTIAASAATLDHIVEVPVRRGIKRAIPQDLKDAKALELATANVRLKELDRERKDYMNRTRDQKKELAGVVDELSVQVKDGVQRIPQDVVKHIDTQHLEIAYLDPKSRMVMEVRTLTAEEMEKELAMPEQSELHGEEPVKESGKGSSKAGKASKKTTTGPEQVAALAGQPQAPMPEAGA